MNSPLWSGGRLIAAAAVLATAGILLLHQGMQGAASSGPVAPPATAAASAGAPTDLAAATAAPPSAAPAAPASAAAADTEPRAPKASARQTNEATPAVEELPPPGSGPDADRLIQQALDQASPADLPAEDEHRLLDAARSAWLSETSAYTQVRIQAATARRDPAPAGAEVRAVVRLVWAGADPAGTLLDGRTAALHYTRIGDGTWNRT